MEVAILSVVDFRVAVPTAHHFLPRAARASASDEVTTALATYYTERCLQVCMCVCRVCVPCALFVPRCRAHLHRLRVRASACAHVGMRV